MTLLAEQEQRETKENKSTECFPLFSGRFFLGLTLSSYTQHVEAMAGDLQLMPWVPLTAPAPGSSLVWYFVLFLFCKALLLCLILRQMKTSVYLKYFQQSSQRCCLKRHFSLKSYPPTLIPQKSFLLYLLPQNLSRSLLSLLSKATKKVSGECAG